MQMQHYTLFELHQFIQRVFYLNFEESVWIEAEISESRSHNGHVYLTMIEKNEAGGLLAKASASIWRNQVIQLKRTLGSIFPQLIKAGNKVRFKGKVEFHPRYGYSIHIEDFDTAFTEGFLYLEKKRTIDKLKKEQLFDKNDSTTVPIVIQRIAVISSPTAAGYQDYMHQLTDNPFNYDFNITLFPSAMQGEKVRDQIPAALSAIEERKEEFDVIIIVRGGGSVVDLSDFDQYEVAAAIAHSSLPVIAGIGHERDLSVADMVARFRVKTPTAAAEFILIHNQKFENMIMESFRTIRDKINTQVHQARQKLEWFEQGMKHRIEVKLSNERQSLERLMKTISYSARLRVHREQLDLQKMKLQIVQNNPFHIMERGYAMVFQNNQRIKDLEQLDIKKPILLQMGQQNIIIHEK